jgi:glycosyltransferase involved in cell wall biosynthesis
VNTAPNLSVVVPHYNGQHFLSKMLAAFERQTFRDFELIVADDGSADPKSAERSVAQSGLVDARVLLLGHGGAGAARNAGIRAARSEIVCFTDCDCIPDRDWLLRMRDALERAELVYGRVVTDDGYLFPRWAAPAGERFVGANFGIRKTLCARIGDFSPSFRGPFREDTDFGLRAMAANAVVLCVPSAVIYHPLRTQGAKKLYSSGYWHRYDAELLKRYGRAALSEIGKSYTQPALAGFSWFGLAVTLCLLGAVVAALAAKPALALAAVAALPIGAGFATIVATFPSRGPRRWFEILENGIAAVPYAAGWYLGRVVGSLAARRLCL